MLMPRLTAAATIAALPSHDYRRRLQTAAQVRAALPPPPLAPGPGPEVYMDGMPSGTCYCRGCEKRRWAASCAFERGWLRSGTAIALDPRRDYPCATGLRN